MGGVSASAEDNPFLARVFIDSDHSPRECAGSIVSERIVVTAAHCLHSKATYRNKTYVVWLGQKASKAKGLDKRYRSLVGQVSFDHSFGLW